MISLIGLSTTGSIRQFNGRYGLLHGTMVDIYDIPMFAKPIKTPKVHLINNIQINPNSRQKNFVMSIL